MVLKRLLAFRSWILGAWLVILLPQAASAQGIAYVKEHYTKQEMMITMRDGIKLFTIVYAPKDISKPYPILLQRTPYSAGPYGSDRFKATVGPSDLFGREGYI